MTNQTLRDQLVSAIREQITNHSDGQKSTAQVAVTTSQTLREIMDKIGANAEKRGLTPDILDSLLRNE